MDQDFFVLEDDYDGGYAKAIYSNSKRDVQIKTCEKCGGIDVCLLTNLGVEFKGSKKADYYGVPQHHIINNKIYKILKENNITGFEIKDIKIYEDIRLERTKKSFRGDGLHELIITGRCGDFRKLNGDLFEKCDQCGRVVEDKDGFIGMKINIDEWDGSDIFYFKNLVGLPIITAKVKEILEINKIKNVTFINVKDFELM